MAISDKRVENILRILEEKVIGKVKEESIPEEYLLTDEQMDRAFQSALKCIDTYEPSLTEKVKSALESASNRAVKGFMLPARLSDKVAEYFKAVREDNMDVFGISPVRSATRGVEVEEIEDAKAAIKELYDYLKTHHVNWYSSKVDLLTDHRMVIGLRRLGVDDYKSNVLVVPEVSVVSNLEEAGGIKGIQVARASNWIRVIIDSENSFPAIDTIGISVSQDDHLPEHLTLTLEFISK